MRADPPGQPRGSLTVNTTVSRGHLGPAPRRGRLLDIAARLPPEHPNLPASTGPPRRRHPRLHQVSSSVDPRGILASTNPVTSHAMTILPDMA